MLLLLLLQRQRTAGSRQTRPLTRPLAPPRGPPAAAARSCANRCGGGGRGHRDNEGGGAGRPLEKKFRPRAHTLSLCVRVRRPSGDDCSIYLFILKSLCGGGVPSSHLPPFFSFFFFLRGSRGGYLWALAALGSEDWCDAIHRVEGRPALYY